MAAESFPATCVATLEGSQLSLREARPDVPTGLAEMVDQLLAADPTPRTRTSAADLAAAIREMMDG